MARLANNLRSLAAMIAAERAIEAATNDQLNAWLPLFYAGLTPDGTTAVNPDAGRAESSRDQFDEDAILAVALVAWRKRYGTQNSTSNPQAAEDRFAAEVRETVHLIPDRTFEVARDVIRAGFKAGHSPETILVDVKAATQAAVGLTAERTGGILGPSAVNDATLAAFTALENETGQRYVKTWVNILDNRTRPTHIEAGADHGNFRIPLTQKFHVGGELADRPRDPSLSIGESANCRCIAAVDPA